MNFKIVKKPKKPLFFNGIGLVDFNNVTEKQADRLLKIGCPYIVAVKEAIPETEEKTEKKTKK